MRRTAQLSGPEAVREAATAIGLVVVTADSDADLLLRNPAGGELAVEIKRVSLATADAIERQIAQWQATPAAGIRLVVADRITEQARQVLSEAGWSWLDLRGHLHLTGSGFFIDTSVPPLTTHPGQPKPLTSPAALEVAVMLMLTPTQPAWVRDIARALGRSASTVSQVITRMQKASLVDADRRPVLPDLFWEAATQWNPEVQPLQLPPPDDGPLREALRVTDWALTDTLAAAAYGAPVHARADHPPDFYLPDQATLRRALHLLGPAPIAGSRAAAVRVAPVPIVNAGAILWPHQKWSLAQPLFVALDLAADPGRGREILAGWTPPPEAGTRVW